MHLIVSFSAVAAAQVSLKQATLSFLQESHESNHRSLDWRLITLPLTRTATLENRVKKTGKVLAWDKKARGEGKSLCAVDMCQLLCYSNFLNKG